MEPRHGWLHSMRRYLAAIAVGSLTWEVAQMPLYTLWRTGSARDIAFAAIHCTGGDVLIAGASLVGGLLLFGAPDWPRSRFLSVAATAVVLGLTYTIYSEHLNTASNAWTYSELMPILPGLGTGLAPLVQWVVVPTLAFGTVCFPLWIGRRKANPGLDLPTVGMTTSRAAAAPDHSARPFGRAS